MEFDPKQFLEEFDPQEYVRQQEALTQPEASDLQDFDPKQFLAEFDPQEYVRQQEAITQPLPSDLPTERPSKSFFDRPALRAEEITDDEISRIAKKWKVSPEELRSYAPYFGVNVEGAAASDLLKEGVGFVGDVLLGAPQKAAKVIMGGDMEKALDELQNRAAENKSYLGLLGEIAAPTGPLVAGGKLATRVATGAGIGAVAGTSAAQQGEELEGALFGAAIGAPLGAAFGSRARVKRSGDVEEAFPEDTQEMLETLGVKGTKTRIADIDDEARSILEREQPLYDVIDPVVRGESALNPIEASRALYKTMGKEKVDALIEAADGNLLKALNDTINIRTMALAEDIEGKSVVGIKAAREVIKEYADRQGGFEAVAKRQDALNRQDARDLYIESADIRDAPPFNNFLTKVFNMFSDHQFILRSIDEKLGTNSEEIGRSINRYKNAYLHALDAVGKTDEKLFLNAKKANVLEAMEDGRILKAIESNTVQNLSEAEQAIAKQVQEIWEAKRLLVNDPNIAPGITSLSIPKRENYVRSQMKAAMDVVSIIRKLSADLAGEASQMFDRTITDIRALNPEEFKMFLDASDTAKQAKNLVNFLEPATRDSLTSKSLSNVLSEHSFNKATYSKLANKASVALERQDVIPDIIREKNMFILLDGWNRNTLRHVFLRDQFNELRLMAKSIRKAGDEESAKYLENYLVDMSGIRPESPEGIIKSLGQSTTDRLNEIITTYGPDSYPGKMAGAVKAIPTIFNSMMMNIYPNMLGLSPRALLLNATQPYVKLAPELGGVYGAEVVTKASLDIAANLGRKETFQKVYDYNLAPPEWTAPLREAMATAVQKQINHSVPAKTLKAMADASMYLYGKGDLINRAITLNAAERVIKDAMDGNPEAVKALRRLPTQLQRSLKRSLTAEDRKTAIRDLAEHLNSTTQYNYNRESMSEFGRLMGPTFSTFSKWPTATVGEVAGAIRDKGIKEGSKEVGRKYVTPFLVLYAADRAIRDSEGELSDRQKKLLGSYGLVGASPAGALGDFVAGEFFSPPAVDLLYRGIIVPAVKGEMDKIGSGVAQATAAFVPGAGYVRFLTDDLVTLLEGERPEGNFFQRSAEGFRTLTK